MRAGRELSVATQTHGRVLLGGSADADRLIVAFHGYAQSAEDMLADVLAIPGAAEWRVASVQALNRFYTRGDQKIVASWMTRQDREQAIADNIGYVDAVIGTVGIGKLIVERTALSRGEDSESASAGAAARVGGAPRAEIKDDSALVFIGFSQGVAMAYRAALCGRHRAAGVIALGGDIPPELKASGVENLARPWCPVLIGAGNDDTWFTSAKVDHDVRFLETHQIPHDVVRFAGGHEWTDAFRAAAGDWLARQAASHN